MEYVLHKHRGERYFVLLNAFFFSATGSHVTIFSTTFYLFNLLRG